MRRLLLSALISVFLFLLGIFSIGESWNYFKPRDRAIVFFNPGVVEGDKLEGEVIRKDKYVVVKPEGKPEETYTWEQIKAITETRPGLTQGLERFLERIDFLSKFSILAAAIVFLIGLIQYEQGQRWKSEEFLASVLKDFSQSKTAQRTRYMLDMARLNPEQGKQIELFPDKTGDEAKSTNVTRDDVYNALSVRKSSYSEKEMVIRESFDGFFDYLERFDHYIELGLVQKGSVNVYINYWIEMLIGEEEMLDEPLRQQVLTYAKHFKFGRVEKFLLKYKQLIDPITGIKLEPKLY